MYSLYVIRGSRGFSEAQPKSHVVLDNTERIILKTMPDLCECISEYEKLPPCSI